jgi:hypothetical protein
MDIITNFAAGEEAVGAIFGGDQDKGKQKVDDPVGSNRGSKRNNRKKKKNHRASPRPRPMSLSLLPSARNLEALPEGVFLTKCSKNRAPTTRGPQTTTSKIATCSAGTLRA